MRPATKILGGTAAVVALSIGGLVTPSINASPAAQQAGVNLPTASAEAAWWDFTVRQVGGKCGYGNTVQVGQGYYRHQVKRYIKTWTSSNWICQWRSEYVTNRTPVPYLGMPGG